LIQTPFSKRLVMPRYDTTRQMTLEICRVLLMFLRIAPDKERPPD